MWSLTKERKDDLIKKKEVRCLWPLLLISNNLILPHYQDKHHELKVLRDMTKEDLWRKDLNEFLEKLEEVERQEREDDAVALNKAKGGSAGKGKGKLKAEVAPSPQGIRVAPRIADELRTKVGFLSATNEYVIILLSLIAGCQGCAGEDEEGQEGRLVRRQGGGDREGRVRHDGGQQGRQQES